MYTQSVNVGSTFINTGSTEQGEQLAANVESTPFESSDGNMASSAISTYAAQSHSAIPHTVTPLLAAMSEAPLSSAVSSTEQGEQSAINAESTQHLSFDGTKAFPANYMAQSRSPIAQMAPVAPRAASSSSPSVTTQLKSIWNIPATEWQRIPLFELTGGVPFGLEMITYDFAKNTYVVDFVDGSWGSVDSWFKFTIPADERMPEERLTPRLIEVWKSQGTLFMAQQAKIAKFGDEKRSLEAAKFRSEVQRDEFAKKIDELTKEVLALKQEEESLKKGLVSNLIERIDTESALKEKIARDIATTKATSSVQLPPQVIPAAEWKDLLIFRSTGGAVGLKEVTYISDIKLYRLTFADGSWVEIENYVLKNRILFSDVTQGGSLVINQANTWGITYQLAVYQGHIRKVIEAYFDAERRSQEYKGDMLTNLVDSVSIENAVKQREIEQVTSVKQQANQEITSLMQQANRRIAFLRERESYLKSTLDTARADYHSLLTENYGPLVTKYTTLSESVRVARQIVDDPIKLKVVSTVNRLLAFKTASGEEVGKADEIVQLVMAGEFTQLDQLFRTHHARLADGEKGIVDLNGYMKEVNRLLDLTSAIKDL